MIKQTLLTAALIAGLTAPAFAADQHGHQDRGQQPNQTQPAQNGGGYGWVPGRYAQVPYQGAQWQPAVWVRLGSFYIMVSGYWF